MPPLCLVAHLPKSKIQAFKFFQFNISFHSCNICMPKLRVCTVLHTTCTLIHTHIKLCTSGFLYSGRGLMKLITEHNRSKNMWHPSICALIMCALSRNNVLKLPHNSSFLSSLSSVSFLNSLYAYDTTLFLRTEKSKVF